MSSYMAVWFVVVVTAFQLSGNATWYIGDARCPPPPDDGRYSAPYDVQEHRQEFPTFFGADRPGWSCSYMRDDGVIVQYGDSRTPQQQWMDVWGNSQDN
jgi:hypothetical protein